MSSRPTASPPNLTPKGLTLKQRREARLQAALRDNLRRRKVGEDTDPSNAHAPTGEAGTPENNAQNNE